MTTETEIRPSLESVQELFVDLNIAMQKFMDTNPNIDNSVVFPAAIRAMMLFPLEWMKNAGTTEHYVDMMNDHVKSLYAAFLMNNVEQEENGASD